MVRPVDSLDGDDLDEDDDDRRPLSVEELDLEYERLTSSWSPLEKFAARVGIIESLTSTGKGLHSTALGKYDVKREVARGGMGVVFEAVDRELGRTVALKLWYEPTGAPDEKIRREAMNLARLSHPNVVVVHEVDRVEDLFYMAMEFVRGRDLRQRLAEPMPWREAVRLFIEAGRGLAAAHEAGLVHGDFKPENILVGEDRRVRVADFGVARAMETDSNDHDREIRPADHPSSDSPIGGTPAYMAPERLAGQRGDARSDQFSFCIALWEAVFGRRPFSGQTELALWVATTEGEPAMDAAVIGISGRLLTTLRRGLAPRPENRFASMLALLDELGECLAEPERQHRRRRTRITILTSVLAGLVVGALSAAWTLNNGPSQVSELDESSDLVARRVVEAPSFEGATAATAAFKHWLDTEPDDPDRPFADEGVELASNLARSARAFEHDGDVPSAISTIMLSSVALQYVIRHYQLLELGPAEREARSRHVSVLRAIEELTGSDESDKIEIHEAMIAGLDATESYPNSGSPP